MIQCPECKHTDVALDVAHQHGRCIYCGHKWSLYSTPAVEIEAVQLRRRVQELDDANASLLEKLSRAEHLLEGERATVADACTYGTGLHEQLEAAQLRIEELEEDKRDLIIEKVSLKQRLRHYQEEENA